MIINEIIRVIIWVVIGLVTIAPVLTWAVC